MHSRKEDKEMLKDFSTIILGKLRANRRKEHWSTLPNDFLITKLEDEVKELKEAIAKGKPAHIAMEAADIAAYAAMIADNNTK